MKRKPGRPPGKKLAPRPVEEPAVAVDDDVAAQQGPRRSSRKRAKVEVVEEFEVRGRGARSRLAGGAVRAESVSVAALRPCMYHSRL